MALAFMLCDVGRVAPLELGNINKKVRHKSMQDLLKKCRKLRMQAVSFQAVNIALTCKT